MAATGSADEQAGQGGAAAFDYLHGAWTVRHRRLAARLSGSQDWQAFGGAMRCRPVLGGLGNLDDNLIEPPGGAYEAVTLRLFNPDEGAWTIHWVDGRDPRLDPPMRGGFSAGVGVFFGEAEEGGRPVRVRFTWDEITPHSARWSQAFCADAGESWETNWVMNFTRAAMGPGQWEPGSRAAGQWEAGQ